MPVDYTDPAFKQWFLSKNNLDPSKYDLDSQGKVFEKPTTDATNDSLFPDMFKEDSNNELPSSTPPQQSTIGKALLHHGEAAIAPTIGGLATGAGAGTLATMAAPWLLGPEVGLPADLLIGGVSLLGGAAGGYGTSKLQNALLPDSANQELAQEEQEHPYASLLGDVGPGLALSNPLKSVKNLATLGGKAFGLGTKSLTSAETSNLANAAANIGFQGGMDVYNQSQSSEPFSFGKLAATIAAGAASNEPNALGHAINPMSYIGRNETPPELPSSGIGDLQGPTLPNPNALQIEDKTPNQGPQLPNPQATQMPNSSLLERNLPQKQLYGENPQIEEPSTSDLTDPYYDNTIKALPNVASPAKRPTQPYEGDTSFPSPTPPTGNLLDIPPASPIRQAGGISPEQPTVANTPVESAADKARLGLTKYQEEPSNPQQSNPNLLVNATDEYKQKVADLANRRGITLTKAAQVLGDKGQPVLGKYEPAARTATVSTSKAELDTPQHEVAHGYLMDLLHSSDPKDVEVAQQGLKIFNGDQKGAEEALIRELGVAGAKRSDAMAGGLGDKIKQWTSDFVSRWKNNLGLASDEDTIRHLTQRLQTDAPYGSRPELLENVARDRRSYNGLVTQLKDEPDWNKKMAIQQQVENLKNKYGGMPPKMQDSSALPSQDFEKPGMEKSNEKSKSFPLDHSTFNLTMPLADRVLQKEGPRALPAINAAINQRNLNESYYNRYAIPIQKATEGLSRNQQDYLERLMLAEQKQGMSYKGTLQGYPKLEAAYDKVRSTLKQMQEDRIANNQPVKSYDETGKPFMRDAKIDPFFYPQRVSPEVVKALQENSPGADKLREDWMNKQMANGMPKSIAEQGLNDLLNSYSKGQSSTDHFRGVDIEQGSGLPYSWMRPGMSRNLEGYIRRYANARAFHDAIESNPNVAPAYGITKSPWGEEYPAGKPLQSPEFQHIVEHITGSDYDPEEGLIKGASKVASSSFLGLQTNWHVFSSTVANALSLAKGPSEIPGAILHSITHFGDSMEHAMNSGIYQNRPKLFRDLFDAHSTMTERLNSLADGVGRLSGRNVTDYMTKGIAQGMGEYVIRRRLPEALSGDINAQKFLHNIDPSYDYRKPFSEQDVWRLASNFVRQLHGTHDFRTLPGWMLKDNIVAPFVSLMSWNVSQTNSFFKNVITPARAGNVKPLLMASLGLPLAGAVIKEMREKLGNKESPIPSFAEIAAGDNDKTKIPLAMYNLMAMASFSGYAGLLSTGAKTLFDIAYKNPMQGAIFPLDETIGNSTKTLSQAATAIMNSDPNEYTSIGTKALADLFKENVQLARIGLSWADESGITGEQRQMAKGLSKETNQLRRFKEVEGLPTEDEATIDETNPYYNMERKAFLRENDLGKAAQMLPQEISMAYAKANGNMEVFKSQMKALKNSRYPSMPSPDNAPMQFWHYIQFLKNTQGDEAAKNRLTEYYYNNAIDKAKNEMVPSY